MSTPYASNIKIVELLERNKGQTTDIKIFRNGSQIIPTAGLYSLKKPNGEFIVEDGTASIDGNGTISYNHTTNELSSTLELGEGYIQEWKVTISNEIHIFRRTGAIVLRRLYPVVSDIDLTSTYSDLEDLRPSNMNSYQQYIDEAWYQILNRLRNHGAGFEYLIMSPESFRSPHINLSLYYIFRDFHSSLAQTNGRYLELAQEHQRLYNSEIDTISYQYDQSHVNRIDDKDKRTRSQPTIFLTRSGQYFRYPRRRR